MLDKAIRETTKC